ncbi:response regulator transcription factor [Microtetraspora malaysiensis]|uniref:response regulator transcription factor n=1 Tax=Microtetraspora malaysiensis TaxID=161358 RepID=UPI003D8AC74E
MADVRGLSDGEIGRRLHLAEGSVKTYMSTILSRLGVRNRVEAALIAYESRPTDASARR